MDARPHTPRWHRGPAIIIVIVAVLAVLAAVVVTVLLFVVPARIEPDSTPGRSEPVTTPQSAEVAPGGILWESEMVADALRSASGDWTMHITSVELATALRRPVIIVTTDIGAEQADLSDDLSAGLASYAGGLTADDGSPYTFFIQVLSTEGEIIGSVSNTDGRWALDAAAAPADTAALRVWLDETFGARSPAPEPWAGRVLSVAEPATDPDGFVVIQTDLDPSRPADLRSAQMIIDAVNASGATFAPGVRVVFGDAAYEWSALLDGTDPYCQP